VTVTHVEPDQCQHGCCDGEWCGDKAECESQSFVGLVVGVIFCCCCYGGIGFGVFMCIKMQKNQQAAASQSYGQPQPYGTAYAQPQAPGAGQIQCPQCGMVLMPPPGAPVFQCTCGMQLQNPSVAPGVAQATIVGGTPVQPAVAQATIVQPVAPAVAQATIVQPQAAQATVVQPTEAKKKDDDEESNPNMEYDADYDKNKDKAKEKK